MYRRSRKRPPVLRVTTVNILVNNQVNILSDHGDLPVWSTFRAVTIPSGQNRQPLLLQLLGERLSSLDQLRDIPPGHTQGLGQLGLRFAQAVELGLG